MVHDAPVDAESDLYRRLYLVRMIIKIKADA